ncbi:class I SAM-dependent methyltransferase [Maribacter sp. X9]|uniref:class I SAM-dependent methyltransferase n=1 Tax=Maribacter sp. X9 TaxID=3402159 RepID=UPI003AF34486
MENRSSKKNKKPWPTKAVMQQIYELNLWGGRPHEFYSGLGSHKPEIVQPYLKVVSHFLSSFEKPLAVCDLGCGDFNIGKKLVKYTQKYVAVDIVPDLIEHHQKKFKAENLEFHCLDLATDDLPVTDCVLIRQVLQHLSNAEIQKVLHKLTDFKYILLTEHIPEGDFIPNIDIISGQGIRLKKQSGVNLLAPPFHFKVKEEKEMLSITSNDFKGRLVTTLYTT